MNEQWERTKVKDCFHIYSDGTRLSVLFETDEDKVFCLNRIAIISEMYGIRVLCPIVMDTHFHIVVMGKSEQVHKLIIQLKRQLAMYFNGSGRSHLIKDGIWIEFEPILDNIELMQKIIYVFRNDLDAGGAYLPEDYPWGAGALFFHEERDGAGGFKISSLSLNERRRLFNTRSRIPDGWMCDRRGMILPQCYIDYRFVMNLFGSPRRFLAFLFVRKKDLAEMDENNARSFIERRRDSELHRDAEVESQSAFGSRVHKLSQAQKLELAKILWQKKKTLSRKQLARAVQMDPEIIEAVFH